MCIIAIRIYLEPNYIRPNQSCLYSRKRQEKFLKQEHQNMKGIVTSYLIRVHHMSIGSPIIEKLVEEMEIRLYQRYMVPLSYLDIYGICSSFY